MAAGARTKKEARDRYYTALSRVLVCVTRVIWVPGESPYGPPGSLTLQIGPEFGAAHPLKRGSGPPVYLAGDQTFTFERDARHHSRWQVRTESYAYHVCTGPDVAHTVLSWHWHPINRDEPHLHATADHGLVERTYGLHQPTGRVAFEDVIRYLIRDLGVIPRTADWETVLDEEQEEFRRTRSWPIAGVVGTD